MFKRTIRVMPSDVGEDGRLKLKRLLDYFQDTAGLAVEDIEGTTTELLKRGYAWVLSRYEIDFNGDMPMLDDSFTITTYHDPNHGYNTLRMFLTDFVTAKSSWLLVDVKKKKPVKPIAHIPGITPKDNREISPDFIEIPDIKEITKSVSLTVVSSDIDYNGHVNNAVYFSWLLDRALDDINISNISKISASFRSGAKLGEVLTLSCEGNICCVMRPDTVKPSAYFKVLTKV